MKQIPYYLIGIILLCISTMAFMPIPADYKGLWIDNFEKKTSKSLQGGNWFFITDSSNKGASKIQPRLFENAYRFDSSLKSNVIGFSYALHKGDFQWPYIGLNLETKATQFKSLSMVKGVAYRYKGAAHTFIYLTSEINDYSHYRRMVPESDEWTTILIPFSELRQPVWGKKQEFFHTSLEGLQWQVQGFEGDTGTVYLDEIRMITKLPKELK